MGCVTSKVKIPSEEQQLIYRDFETYLEEMMVDEFGVVLWDCEKNVQGYQEKIDQFSPKNKMMAEKRLKSFRSRLLMHILGESGFMF